MTSNVFLFSNSLTGERLSWIADSLKNFFVTIHPDALRHPLREKSPFFIFFITGDALYSLHEEETLHLWDIILSLPSVWLVCDADELTLRGLSVSSLAMKYPGEVFEKGRAGISDPSPFWKDLIRVLQQTDPDARAIGYVQTASPFINRSGANSLSCLNAAVQEKLSPEFYACLDGIFAGHINQNPTESVNIGAGLEKLAEEARKNGLLVQMLASAESAAARGCNTWDDGRGTIISACTIDPFRIRHLNAIVDRFRHGHCILMESAGVIDITDIPGTGRELWEKAEDTPPSLIVLITRSPYGTGYTFGGLAFAIACAHNGIATRVIFLEDGIYSLTGVQKSASMDLFSNIQELVDRAGGNENLEFYAYLPSFHKRTAQKNRKLNAVLDIGPVELTTLLFFPPRGVHASHQRILFF